jgi:hypothetical protein
MYVYGNVILKKLKNSKDLFNLESYIKNFLDNFL